MAAYQFVSNECVTDLPYYGLFAVISDTTLIIFGYCSELCFGLKDNVSFEGVRVLFSLVHLVLRHKIFFQSLKLVMILNQCYPNEKCVSNKCRKRNYLWTINLQVTA